MLAATQGLGERSARVARFSVWRISSPRRSWVSSWMRAMASEGKELALRSSSFQAECNVLGGVARFGLAERESGLDAGPEGTILGECEPLPSFGQADEDDREQRLGIPLVVGQDVQVVEHILVEQVGLVDEWR